MKKRFNSLLFFLILFLSIEAQNINTPKFKVVAFDAFPIFDPRHIAKTAEEVFPGNGKKLMEIWRTRIFEYQWLRALGNKYKNFMSATESGLIYSTKHLKLDLTEEKKEKLLSEFKNLKMWPDAPDAIRKLKSMGLELVFLSNMTKEMLFTGLKKEKLENEFKYILSTDKINSYKPDPTAYSMATKVFGIPKSEILFVAFAGWDVVGSKWFGYPTFWVNRLGAINEELDQNPDGKSKDLSGLVDFIIKHNQ